MFNRKKHWQNIYQDKSALEVSWYQTEPKLSLELIRNTNISSNEPIIDVGGGASALVDHLIAKGFSNLSVLDISKNALQSTQKRLGNLAKIIKWIDSDITQFKAPLPFSLWHDRAVFHFLTEQTDRNLYLESLNHSLKEGGHLIIAAFAIGGPTKCSGLDIVQYDADKLKKQLGDNFDLIEQRSEVHITPTNKEQMFNYFYFHKNK